MLIVYLICYVLVKCELSIPFQNDGLLISDHILVIDLMVIDNASMAIAEVVYVVDGPKVQYDAQAVDAVENKEIMMYGTDQVEVQEHARVGQKT